MPLMSVLKLAQRNKECNSFFPEEAKIQTCVALTMRKELCKNIKNISKSQLCSDVFKTSGYL